jgi:hypothetical protein
VTTLINKENVQWVHDFVINSIVQWQLMGLNPIIPEHSKESIEYLIKDDYSVTWTVSKSFE